MERPATERGLDDPAGIEHESFEAQAMLFSMFKYLRAEHPELARQHGYEV